MEGSSSDDVDDSINLESKVLAALARLQKEKQLAKTKRKHTEVSCPNIVKFLKCNYPWLDGDIESQVLTALLSCVKAGIVCALSNGLYRLVGPNSKMMTKKCVTRISHGPKCSCLEMLKFTLKTGPRTCCHLKNADSAGKKVIRTRGKGRGKPRIALSASRKSNKAKKRCAPTRKSQLKCAQSEQKLIGTSKNSLKLLNQSPRPKCEYCKEVHSVPETTKPCAKCFPRRAERRVHFDKFSPRDEFECA